MKGLNNFLKNKNTVTVLGIILIVFLLFIGFNTTIQTTVNPVNIPVAKQKILPETQITQDMVEYTSVSKIVLRDNVIKNLNNIIGKYTNVNVVIPQGSMFYTEWLVNAEDLPGNWLKQIKFSDGEEAQYYNVDTASTYGNSILPGSYIDIEMRIGGEEEKIMYGKLFRNIKVLAVHDGNGNNVFSDPEKKSTPANIVFALSHDNSNLLMRAKYLSRLSKVELTIKPQGENSSGEKAEFVSSATLRDYIDKQTKSVSDEKLKEVTEKN